MAEFVLLMKDCRIVDHFELFRAKIARIGLGFAPRKDVLAYLEVGETSRCLKNRTKLAIAMGGFLSACFGARRLVHSILVLDVHL